MQEIYNEICSMLIYFKILNFTLQKILLGTLLRWCHSLNPFQAQHSFRPDLDQDCLQRDNQNAWW